MQNYDITIIGSGMVGATLAHALRDTALRVAVVDATPLTAREDNRLIALNFQSYTLFQQLNLWEKLAANACPIQEVHVSQQRRFGAVRLRANDINLPILGYVVPARFINAALEADLPQNITSFRPATLKHLTQTAEQITVDLGEKKFSTRILIGADGSHSTVRQLLNISVEQYDYQQSALVTVTHLQRSHQYIAYERFLKNGAIAMLPLTEQRAATIWSGPTAEIKALLVLDEATFLKQLQQQFGYRLGLLQKTEQRSLFPLQMQHATDTVKQNIALIGNAAHTLHPIAAQGLNLALHEVGQLVNHFKKQTADTLSLQHFVSQTSAQTFTLRLSHLLARLFSLELPFMSFARQIGMISLDHFLPAKKSLTEKTAGKRFLLQNSLNSFEID